MVKIVTKCPKDEKIWVTGAAAEENEFDRARSTVWSVGWNGTDRGIEFHVRIDTPRALNSSANSTKY